MQQLPSDRVRLGYTVPPGWAYVPDSFAVEVDQGSLCLGMTIFALDLRASLPVRIYDIRTPLLPRVPEDCIARPDTWYNNDLTPVKFLQDELPAWTF